MEVPSPSAAIFTLIFILFPLPSFTHNITKILDPYPDFTIFNQYLSQTQLAAEINRRQTITILAVQIDAVSFLSGQPEDTRKRILSVHVILDYEDVLKLRSLKEKSTIMTTLYQATGKAEDQNGFLNVSNVAGEIFFRSSTKGSKQTSKLVKNIAGQPYNISVLQVSSVITPPGMLDAPIVGVPPPPETIGFGPGPGPGPGPAPEPAVYSPPAPTAGSGNAPANADNGGTQPPPDEEEETGDEEAASQKSGGGSVGGSLVPVVVKVLGILLAGF